MHLKVPYQSRFQLSQWMSFIYGKKVEFQRYSSEFVGKSQRKSSLKTIKKVKSQVASTEI
jgi:hypothetical protein